MFTGLIQELGTIKNLSRKGSNLDLEIEANEVISELKLGDSIAIDGVCQTAVAIDAESFIVTAIEETLKLTNFNEYKLGTKVNLELCLRLSDRVGGHLVQGHVDAVGEVKSIIDQNGSYEIEISFPAKLRRYIIHKGSISVNGISLTVAEITDSNFKICIIPKTWEMTNISQLKPGSKVNLEVDMMAKYVENLVKQ